MELVEFAYASLRHADPAVRSEAIRHLDALSATLESAMEVWRSVDTNRPRHSLGSLMYMMDAAAIHRLDELSRAADQELKALCNLAGPAAAQRASLIPHLVETAYWQLKEAETLADRVASNLAKMGERVARLKAMREELSASAAPERMAA